MGLSTREEEEKKRGKIRHPPVLTDWLWVWMIASRAEGWLRGSSVQGGEVVHLMAWRWKPTGSIYTWGVIPHRNTKVMCKVTPTIIISKSVFCIDKLGTFSLPIQSSDLGRSLLTQPRFESYMAGIRTQFSSSSPSPPLSHPTKREKKPQQKLDLNFIVLLPLAYTYTI